MSVQIEWQRKFEESVTKAQSVAETAAKYSKDETIQAYSALAQVYATLSLSLATMLTSGDVAHELGHIADVIKEVAP